jgi:hypothetical protein
MQQKKKASSFSISDNAIDRKDKIQKKAKTPVLLHCRE